MLREMFKNTLKKLLNEMCIYKFRQNFCGYLILSCEIKFCSLVFIDSLPTYAQKKVLMVLEETNKRNFNWWNK